MLKYYQRLRNIREDNDYSQTSFAKRIGLNRSTYSKYECGINDIPLNTLDIIAQKLDVSLDYIFGLSKKKKYENMGNICLEKLFENLRYERLKKELSQLDIANYLDVNQNMISYYEKGVYIIPTKKLVLFCEITKTSIDYITGRINSNEIIRTSKKKEISK